MSRVQSREELADLRALSTSHNARLAFTTRRDLPSTVRALIHHLRAGFPQDVSDKGREAVPSGTDARVYFFRSATVQPLGCILTSTL